MGGAMIFWIAAALAAVELWHLSAIHLNGLPPVWVRVVVPGVLFLFGLAIYRGDRSRRRRLAQQGEVFDEGTGKVRRKGAIGHFGGREAALFESGGGKRGTFYFNAQLSCSLPFTFDIYPRAGVTIGKPRGSFETGDAKLDHDLAFASDDSNRFKAWLAKPENKERLVSMLHAGSGRSRLEAAKGRLTWGIRGGPVSEMEGLTFQPGSRFVKIDKQKQANLERDRIRELFETLNSLAASLEARA